MTIDNTPVRKFSAKDMTSSFRNLQWELEGTVCDVIGTIIEAKFPLGRLGTLVDIDIAGQEKPVLAEIVGFRNDRTLLIPYSDMKGITNNSRIKGRKLADRIPVGDFLLGKVVDAFMQTLDGKSLNMPRSCDSVPVEREAPNPMTRARIAHQLPLGVRAIDGLLSFGEGQRIGIMAGSGVGKSMLLGMIAKGSSADINVIGLIGERGREIREFIERDLGEEGLRRSIIVVATSDQSALMRIRAAKVTMAIAEYFSQQGKKVLLMMDSLSRVAQSQREVGLAIGEPPTSKGYPPSVFSFLPKLLERCGTQQESQGSISGLFTVLVDGDDFTDPMPDMARSILDGHINLSRSLAAKGHFPAIEVTTSVSRVMTDIISPQHLDLANRARALLATYLENLDFIQMGTYQKGTNLLLDEAMNRMRKIENFLRQNYLDLSPIHNTMSELIKIFFDEAAR